MPAGAARQGVAHYVRAYRRANAPHAVKPAHMAGFEMQSDVIIQRCVHPARAQPVGDCEQRELPELRCD